MSSSKHSLGRKEEKSQIVGYCIWALDMERSKAYLLWTSKSHSCTTATTLTFTTPMVFLALSLGIYAKMKTSHFRVEMSRFQRKRGTDHHEKVGHLTAWNTAKTWQKEEALPQGKTCRQLPCSSRLATRREPEQTFHDPLTRRRGTSTQHRPQTSFAFLVHTAPRSIIRDIKEKQ